jgi:hypothetical protein
LDLLSCWLQFTDFKPDQKVILAHALAKAGFAHGIQLGGWNFKKFCKKSQTGPSLLSKSKNFSNTSF